MDILLLASFTLHSLFHFPFQVHRMISVIHHIVFSDQLWFVCFLFCFYKIICVHWTLENRFLLPKKDLNTAVNFVYMFSLCITLEYEDYYLNPVNTVSKQTVFFQVGFILISNIFRHHYLPLHIFLESLFVLKTDKLSPSQQISKYFLQNVLNSEFLNITHFL